MTTILDELRVIDADSHVIEPTDLWSKRLPSSMADRSPRVVWDDVGKVHRWMVADRWLSPVASYNMARWKEFVPSYPDTLEESDPAGFDPHRRLERLDEYQIYAQVLYPNIIGFDTHAFMALGPEMSLECVRAYNDFLTEFASADPRRLLPIAMLPFWDVDATITEMQRCRDMGHRGALWAAQFDKIGLPGITRPHWDRVYAAAQDLDVTLNLHIGIGAFSDQDRDFIERTRREFTVSGYTVGSALTFLSNIKTIGLLLTSDLFDRFPQLQVVSVESGFGYLPYLLESLDWQWKNSGGLQHHPTRRMPSEYFFTNVYGTFWFESESLALLNYRPEYADHLMFETDFPHPTSLTPGPASYAENPHAMLRKNLSGLPDAVVEKLVWGTASRLYGVD